MVYQLFPSILTKKKKKLLPSFFFLSKLKFNMCTKIYIKTSIHNQFELVPLSRVLWLNRHLLIYKVFGDLGGREFELQGY